MKDTGKIIALDIREVGAVTAGNSGTDHEFFWENWPFWRDHPDDDPTATGD